MALLLQLDDVERLDHTTWKARLSPSEIRAFDSRAACVGAVSVLLLSRQPVFDSGTKKLTFDTTAAKVLNCGSSNNAVVICDLSPLTYPGPPPKIDRPPIEESDFSGDRQLLESLPPHLKELGIAILSAVRERHAGDLRFFQASGKYVETPDNFWTIRPQPRDRSFRITVRGRPDEFENGGQLDIRPDMGSYSSFKITAQSQIADALSVLNQVRKKNHA